MKYKIKTLLRQEFENRRRVSETLSEIDISVGKQLSDSMERVSLKLSELAQKQRYFSLEGGE